MRIALAQLNPTIGAFTTNVNKLKHFYYQAAANRAELVVFGELSLSGYPPKDLLLYSSVTEMEDRILQEEIVPLTANGNPDILVGTTCRNGTFLYNSAVHLSSGKIKSVHYKTLLPNYDVFDEKRYFTPASERKVAIIGSMPVAVTICEDIWNDSDFFTQPIHNCDPINELFSQGAEFMINLSASPYNLGKHELREEMLSFLARKYNSAMIYLNQVGGNDELIFDGSSLIYNNRGELIYRAAAFEEELIFIETDRLREKAENIFPPGTDDISTVYKALLLGLKDYVRKTGFEKVVLGLSGGIDSAVVAALASKALGPDKILGILMPSQYSSEHSVSDALDLANNLGIEYRIVPIERPFRAFTGLLNKKRDVEQDLAEENLQARIRGAIVMHHSNREGYLALTTGNKSEISVGYCTLYGDMAGGLAVIADLPKIMVYDLANYINSLHEEELIPLNTITKAPSAELRPDQKDEDSLPPYSILDPILKYYIEDNLSAEEISARGFDEKVVRKLIFMVDRAEFKRRQAAPGLRITTHSFGMARRMPIARGYEY